MTCLYCEYHRFNYDEKIPPFMMEDKGYCEKYGVDVDYNAQICEEFLLKRGMHTTKWYPKGTELKCEEDFFDYFKK